MPEALHFREITSADIPALFEVRMATWHNDRGAEELAALGITPASVREQLATTHRGWLCEVKQEELNEGEADSQVVGFAIGNRDNGEMWVIAVLEPFEGRGIGRKLLTAVEDWLFNSGHAEIWLTTDPDETVRAVGFYRRCGWTDWKLDGDRFMKKTRSRSSQT